MQKKCNNNDIEWPEARNTRTERDTPPNKRCSLKANILLDSKMTPHTTYHKLGLLYQLNKNSIINYCFTIINYIFAEIISIT